MQNQLFATEKEVLCTVVPYVNNKIQNVLFQNFMQRYSIFTFLQNILFTLLSGRVARVARVARVTRVARVAGVTKVSLNKIGCVSA